MHFFKSGFMEVGKLNWKKKVLSDSQIQWNEGYIPPIQLDGLPLQTEQGKEKILVQP